jgi:hypothetical protein
MQASPVEFIDILARIESLKTNKLVTDEEKLDILRDIQTLIPAHENYARNCANTKRVLLRVLTEAINGKQKESSPKTQKRATKSSKEELLRDTDVNTGRTGAAKTMVKQAPKKRRATNGGSRRAS